VQPGAYVSRALWRNRLKVRPFVAISVLTIGSFGALIWSIYKTFAVGFHASDTHTSGAVDQAVWLWFFGSIAALAMSSIAFKLLLRRDERKGGRA
jgi:hypothetical protein